MKKKTIRQKAEEWADAAEVEIGGGTPEMKYLMVDLVHYVSVTAWIAGYRSCKRERKTGN